MAIAGHVSREMLEHYSHICMEAKRQAVAAIESYNPEKLDDPQDVAQKVN
jgi:hypothetical protein